MKLMIFGAAVVAVACYAFEADAKKQRSCSPAERASANAELLAIAADETRTKQLIKQHLPFGAHKSSGSASNEMLLVQGGYVMRFDADLRTTLWSAYRLTRKDVEQASGRQRVNCFRTDPRLPRRGGPSSSDYDERIYDQGHIAPDADFKDQVIEQVNSYVYTNMSPQEDCFNRGIWLSLEHLTRAWAKKYGEIYVTSGAIFDRNDDNRRDADSNAMRMESRNGKSRVAVPSHYYKIMLRKDRRGFRAIGFLFEHNDEKHGVAWDDVRDQIKAAVTPIAVIEDKADIRVHPGLPRSDIQVSASGAGWRFQSARSNAEGTCKSSAP